jgi:hypothetical protein
MNRIGFTARLLLLAFIVIIGAASWAQQKDVPAEAKASSSDEQQIRDGVVAFVKLYNAHKPEELAALFAPDSRMVFRDGTEVNGRDEIRQTFEETFLDTPQVAISVVVDSIRF